jgi:hypothetical protein
MADHDVSRVATQASSEILDPVDLKSTPEEATAQFLAPACARGPIRLTIDVAEATIQVRLGV